MTPLDDSGLRVGIQLLADLRGEIARADTKATVLVGALGISGSALAALLANRSWSPAQLPGPAAVLWWTGATSLVISLFALLLAVLPRYRGSRWAPGRPLTYFGDICRAAQVGLLTTALAETGRDPASGLLLALGETSGIAARKHFWIRTGLLSFGCAAVLLPGSLLIA
ncbi:Pycsar system effector family protein [Streptomyces sp. enrichment culture]|uniref:Pycsar system effector family protein n=1 Tax=Streptomyces sp. enrichment culture TaxID=1795815 RepID=UPI003F551BAF